MEYCKLLSKSLGGKYLIISLSKALKVEQTFSGHSNHFYEISKISHICSIFRKSVRFRVVYIF